jgi:hypothetical protein
MCELVYGRAINYSKENFNIPGKTPANTGLQPKPENNMCMPPAFNGDFLISSVLLQKAPVNPVRMSVLIPIENTADKTIQSVTSTASTVTSALNKIPAVIANISEIQSNSTLMIYVSKMAGPTAKVLTESKAFQAAAKVVGNPYIAKGAGTLGVISGGFEIKNGIKEIRKNNVDEGMFIVFDGASNTVAGGGLILGSTMVASGGAAFGLGLSGGHFGDKAVKQLGWLTDSKGRKESVSDRLGNKMWDVHEAVEKSTGSDILAHTAAVGAGLFMLPAAGIVAVGGALAGGGRIIGDVASSAWSHFR